MESIAHKSNLLWRQELANIPGHYIILISVEYVTIHAKRQGLSSIPLILNVLGVKPVSKWTISKLLLYRLTRDKNNIYKLVPLPVTFMAAEISSKPVVNISLRFQ